MGDAVIEVEAAGVEHGVDAVEEGGVVRDADVLDDADGGDLVVAGAGGDVTEAAVFHPASSREPEGRDARGRVVGLRAREGDAEGADAVVLHGPDGEAAPAAADVEQGLVGRQPQLPADQVELVGLRLLEPTGGVAVIGARVHHERIEEERIEIV